MSARGEFDPADVRLHHQELQPGPEPHPPRHPRRAGGQQMGALVEQQQAPADARTEGDDRAAVRTPQQGPVVERHRRTGEQGDRDQQHDRHGDGGTQQPAHMTRPYPRQGRCRRRLLVDHAAVHLGHEPESEQGLHEIRYVDVVAGAGAEPLADLGRGQALAEQVQGLLAHLGQGDETAGRPAAHDPLVAVGAGVQRVQAYPVHARSPHAGQSRWRGCAGGPGRRGA